MEYYLDGKIDLKKKRFQEAKVNFLAYQKFADAKRYDKLPEEFKTLPIKDPCQDKHLEYLELIQRKLNEEVSGDDDPDLSLVWTGTPASNPYTALREEWRKAFPRTSSAPASSASSASTSSTSSTSVS